MLSKSRSSAVKQSCFRTVCMSVLAVPRWGQIDKHGLGRVCIRPETAAGHLSSLSDTFEA